MHCHVAVFFILFLSGGCCFKFELFDVRFISPLLLFYSSVCDHNTTSSLDMKVFLLCFFLFFFLREEAFIMAGRGQDKALDCSGEMGHSCTLPHQLGILPGQWDRGLRVLDRTAHIYLIGVWLCVCVCVCSLLWTYMTQRNGKGAPPLKLSTSCFTDPWKANFRLCSQQQF